MIGKVFLDIGQYLFWRFEFIAYTVHRIGVFYINITGFSFYVFFKQFLPVSIVSGDLILLYNPVKLLLGILLLEFSEDFFDIFSLSWWTQYLNFMQVLLFLKDKLLQSLLIFCY